MFENPKQSTGIMQGVDCRSGSVDYDPRSMKVPECEESLGSKLETTYYTVNRIVSRIETIRCLLFGEATPQCDNDGGLRSIEDAVNGLRYNTADIEKALDRIVYKLSGNN